MIGDAIRQLREQRGWNQDELAKRAKSTQANISKMERGDAKGFSTKVLKALAKAFDVQVWELFAQAEGVELTTSEKLSAQEVKLLETYRALPPERQGILLKLANSLRHTKSK